MGTDRQVSFHHPCVRLGPGGTSRPDRDAGLVLGGVHALHEANLSQGESTVHLSIGEPS